MGKKSQYELEVLGQMERLEGKIEKLQMDAKCIDDAIAIEKNMLRTLTGIHQSASGIKNEEE